MRVYRDSDGDSIAGLDSDLIDAILNPHLLAKTYATADVGAASWHDRMARLTGGAKASESIILPSAAGATTEYVAGVVHVFAAWQLHRRGCHLQHGLSLFSARRLLGVYFAASVTVKVPSELVKLGHGLSSNYKGLLADFLLYHFQQHPAGRVALLHCCSVPTSSVPQCRSAAAVFVVCAVSLYVTHEYVR